MSFEDLTKLIEKQGVDIYKVNLQQFIQPMASGIEERIEYLNANGYEDNEDIIEALIKDATRLIRKLRKHGVII